MELSMIDKERLFETFDLEDPDDRKVLKDLYDVVLSDGSESLSCLFQAMREEKLEAVDRIAHQLKSSLGNVGFLEASRHCNKIMEEARSGSSKEAERLVKELEASTQDILDRVRGFMESL